MSRSETQAEAVRAALEQDILSGALEPGTSLEEGRIAERYDVSRTPVREAINQLVYAGLVEKPARRRAIVRAMDTAKLLEMFELLAELEGLSAAFSAERMTTTEKQTLRELHAEAKAALEADPGGSSYIALGRRFHDLITEGSRNHELVLMTQQLGNRLFAYRRYQAMAPGRLQANQNEHDEILDAILAGDADQARNAMRAHTTRQGDLLVRYIALHKVTPHDLRSAGGARGG